MSTRAFRTVTDGLRFPEGPVVMPDGSVALVEIEARRISRIDPKTGSRETIAETGGGPNGMAIGPDGNLYVANNGGFSWMTTPEGTLLPIGTPDDYAGGSIQRVDPRSGRVETLFTHAGEVPLRGPNDIVFDAAGGMWVSDFGKHLPRSEDRTGLFYAKADGSAIEEAIFPLRGPNGVGLSPDGATLYAAETFTGTLHHFPLGAPGRPSVGSMPGFGGNFLHRSAGPRYYDSLAVEECGNVCVATLGPAGGGIHVISPAGEEVEFVAIDDPLVTNIAFGGEDMRTAYITLSGTGRLLECRWPRPGLRLAF